MKLSLFSYQNTTRVDPVVGDTDEEKAALMGGYGSVYDAQAVVVDDEIDLADFRGIGNESKVATHKRWVWIGIAALVYVAVTVGMVSSRNTGDWSNSAMTEVELLGKTKVDTTTKEMEKMEAKAAKMKEKEEEKEKKVEEKKVKEAEKIKEEKEKAKELEEEKKLAEVKTFEPEPYPGCLEVNVTYIKTPLPFWDHEFAANASGCHLASIHSFEENTKFSKDGLFKMSLGPEIALSFMSGKPLSKVFWLGGYHFESDIDGSEWTDDSIWDFGPDYTNATEGCLSSKFNFTEIAIKNLTFLNHWDLIDCETPLPAIYKCCIMPEVETVGTEAVPDAEPAF